MLTDKMLNVIFVNTYFDFEDYVAPVKTFLDERASYRFANGSKKYIEIYAQKRTAKYSDSYYDVFEQAKTEEFIGVETISQDFDTESGAGAVLFQVFIKLDPNQQAYGREVYSFFDLTGDVGRVFELMCLLGAVVVGILSNRQFYYSVLSKIYQVDVEATEEPMVDDGELKDCSMQYLDNNDILSIAVSKKSPTSIYPLNTISSPRYKSQGTNDPKVRKDQNLFKTKNTENYDEMYQQQKNKIMKKALGSMQHRRKYDYSWKDVLFGLL